MGFQYGSSLDHSHQGWRDNDDLNDSSAGSRCSTSEKRLGPSLQLRRQPSAPTGAMRVEQDSLPGHDVTESIYKMHSRYGGGRIFDANCRT